MSHSTQWKANLDFIHQLIDIFHSNVISSFSLMPPSLTDNHTRAISLSVFANNAGQYCSIELFLFFFSLRIEVVLLCLFSRAGN